VVELLHQQGMDDVMVLVGGIIPDEDIQPLRQAGIDAVFGPGTSTQDIVAFIKQRTAVPA
jgi:methylmalonyl-CoA mutase C-terminal domain/subunit